MSVLLETKRVEAGPSRVTERHYSVAEVAEMWSLAVNTVRRLFENEPGVLAIGEHRPKFGRRRGKVTLRIPGSVVERVHRRLSKC